MRAHNLNKFCTKNPLGNLLVLLEFPAQANQLLLITYEGLSGDQGAGNGTVTANKKFDEAILIDQSTVTKTPRSNPILYTDGWSPIKEALGRTEDCKLLIIPSDFSFNSGNGRWMNAEGWLRSC